jgi:hypothetical protein
MRIAGDDASRSRRATRLACVALLAEARLDALAAENLELTFLKAALHGLVPTKVSQDLVEKRRTEPCTSTTPESASGVVGILDGLTEPVGRVLGNRLKGINKVLPEGGAAPVFAKNALDLVRRYECDI